jgi:hypothetical protein
MTSVKSVKDPIGKGPSFKEKRCHAQDNRGHRNRKIHRSVSKNKQNEDEKYHADGEKQV